MSAGSKYNINHSPSSVRLFLYPFNTLKTYNLIKHPLKEDNHLSRIWRAHSLWIKSSHDTCTKKLQSFRITYNYLTLMFWHDFCSLLTTMVYSHIEATVSLVEAVKNVESGCTEWLVVFKYWKSFVPVLTRAINQNKRGVSHGWKANLWRTRAKSYGDRKKSAKPKRAD